MKQTEIVWIYGASGAGKDTFIKKMQGEGTEKIVEQFGWQGMDILPCRESLEWLGVLEGDALELRRKALLEVVVKMMRPNAVILIKGQVIDLTTDRVRQLKKMIPDAKHRLVFIDAPIEELYERSKEKGWFKERPWYRKSNKREMARWRKFQLDLLKKLEPEFEISFINGANTGHYEFIKLSY